MKWHFTHNMYAFSIPNHSNDGLERTACRVKSDRQGDYLFRSHFTAILLLKKANLDFHLQFNHVYDVVLFYC